MTQETVFSFNQIEKLADEIMNTDNVNHPAHYTFGEIEVIDYIKDKLTTEQYIGYCLGNTIKYVSRYRLKNGVEDLEKAQVYLGWAVEAMVNEEQKAG